MVFFSCCAGIQVFFAGYAGRQMSDSRNSFVNSRNNSVVRRNNFVNRHWIKLAGCCAQKRLPTPTIDQIYDYVLIYRQAGDTRAEDFQATAKAVLTGLQARDPLGAAVTHANGVHGWRGRTAYHLLAAADDLVQAAAQLLMDGNLSYIGEKLGRVFNHLPAAVDSSVSAK
jgi:hypothetical protein